MEWLGLWWHQPDNYDHFSAHLAARGLAPLARATTGSIAACLSLMAVGTLWIPGGPRGVPAQGCALLASVGATSGALLWALCWPTRRQAIRFALISSVSIALVALAQEDPVVATLVLTPLAMMASYIAMFHNAWLLAVNLFIAVVTGTVEAVRLAERLNVVSALCAFALLMLLNLATPYGIQIVTHVLGSDAVLAEYDQLTGLLTRRAYQRGAMACLERAIVAQAHVVVTVIDLDRFKQLNDSYGHCTGDDALVSVACALRDTNADTAVIGRAGGEEFVIADICQPDEVDRRAQELCDVIAALPFGITASIGTAGVHPAQRTGSVDELLVELIAAADAAMYEAKRGGGNRVGHHEWPTSAPHRSRGEDANSYRDGGLSA